MNAGQHPNIASWGVEIPTTSNALSGERALEQAVSNYLQLLRVLFICVPGESNKANDRAYLEQSLIALVSNFCRPLDPPSHTWLGLASGKKEIRKSGLWNVNHTNQKYDSKFLEILDYYVSLTLGTKPAPLTQMAPTNWLSKVKEDNRQLSLL